MRMPNAAIVDWVIAASAALWYRVVDPRRLRKERASSSQSNRRRVSIPIATYDRIDVLVDRTIPAILNQTHDDLEVIVVGDGSPKSLWDRLSEIEDDRVRRVRLRRRTRYPSDPLALWMVAGWRPRNLGARLADGEWILWMSDDDILPPNALASMLEVAAQAPQVEVISGTKQSGTVQPRMVTLENAGHGLGLLVVGMPLLCRSSLRAFRWNRHSWRKKRNRPIDFDLLERMGKAKVRMGITRDVVAIHPEVSDTGLIGSKGAIAEELRRRARGEAQSG
jgi:glycosyltransferase involved in cell wall biosynthesis